MIVQSAAVLVICLPYLSRQCGYLVSPFDGSPYTSKGSTLTGFSRLHAPDGPLRGCGLAGFAIFWVHWCESLLGGMRDMAVQYGEYSGSEACSAIDVLQCRKYALRDNQRDRAWYLACYVLLSQCNRVKVNAGLIRKVVALRSDRREMTFGGKAHSAHKNNNNSRTSTFTPFLSHTHSFTFWRSLGCYIDRLYDKQH